MKGCSWPSWLTYIGWFTHISECRVAVADSLWSQAGLVLTFLSLATVGLGIADVFFSYVTFCTQDDYATSCSPAGGSNYGDVLTFTWVSAGIWGGILVRVALRWPPSVA